VAYNILAAVSEFWFSSLPPLIRLFSSPFMFVIIVEQFLRV
jgi:hypothetical protein